MSPYYTIPLEPLPDQQIYVTVPVNGKNMYLSLRIRYNTEANFWRLEIYDGNTGDCIVAGIPLVTGESPAYDLLRQLKYLGIGSLIILRVNEETILDRPTLFDLGTDFVLIWGS